MSDETQSGMTATQATQLRAPFPKELINQLPKAGKMFDYVGHAATTDRLLQVDPEWTWTPMAIDDQGSPVFDEKGGLWIWLTVCGVTRPGYGESGSIGAKEAIGDAIRNAAMRFGVALDLWAKEDLSKSVTDRMPTDAEKNALCSLFARKGDKTLTEAAAWLVSMGSKADSANWVEKTRLALLDKPDPAKSSVDAPKPGEAITTEPELPAEPSTVPDPDEKADDKVPF